MTGRPRKGVTADDRFWALVSKAAVHNGCWVWQGYRMPFGHGRFRVDGRKVLAHRFAYAQLKGPIPEGLTLDHLCNNPPCVNPDHLEPVTLTENFERGKQRARHRTNWR